MAATMRRWHEIDDAGPYGAECPRPAGSVHSYGVCKNRTSESEARKQWLLASGERDEQCRWRPPKVGSPLYVVSETMSRSKLTHLAKRRANPDSDSPGELSQLPASVSN